ncbi:MAG: DNA adenine methylase [Endomicrobium sp.]|jgi:adenine-specific DNA-methyltransferase|nr:DNA adenine methylase [Endomicrobium sp.]
MYPTSVLNSNLNKINNFDYFKIHQRRYLGNKTAVLNFIEELIKNEIGDFYSFCDIFAGTGTVSDYFNEYGKKIITNDLLLSNYICLYAWLNNTDFDFYKIQYILNELNEIKDNQDNYVSLNFGNRYFTYKNAIKIGHIREKIEIFYETKYINFKEKTILLTSLLYAMDKVANTVGHYDAYIERLENIKEINLGMPYIEVGKCFDNEIFNLDANELIKNIEVDILYLDPPYNSRQYSDNYHLLENIIRWDKPNLYGKTKKFDRTSLKSKYCLSSATEIFNDLIQNAKAKYILLSYNNTENKRNNRSNAKIMDEDILNILSAKGQVKIFEKDYKIFTTGNTKLNENKERVFLCKVKNGAKKCL